MMRGFEGSDGRFPNNSPARITRRDSTVRACVLLRATAYKYNIIGSSPVYNNIEIASFFSSPSSPSSSSSSFFILSKYLLDKLSRDDDDDEIV